MPQPFIIPNWHVVILHAPLGLLTVGIILEILGYARPRSSMRTAARWMILLGALLAIPTITLGMYGFRQVVAPTASYTSPWQEVAAQSPWQEVQWQYMRYHIWLEVSGSLLAALVVVFWLASSPEGRERLHGAGVLLLLVALGLILTGAWFAGESVYRYGTAVAAVPPGIAGTPSASLSTSQETDERNQRHDRSATQPAHESGTSENQSTAELEPQHTQTDALGSQVEQAAKNPAKTLKLLFPPIQLHLLFVGLTLALSLAAIGLTIHRWSQPRILVTPPPPPTPPAFPQPEPARSESVPAQPGRPSPVYGPAVISQTVTYTAFPARVWLAALVAALLVALAGLWLTGDWRVAALLEPLRQEPMQVGHDRVFWHVVFGVSIIVMIAVLSLSSRFLARGKFVNSVWIIMLLIAVALQLWMGILLLYDGMNGPLTAFRAV